MVKNIAQRLNVNSVCFFSVSVNRKARSPEERQLAVMIKLFKDVYGSDSAQQMRTLPLHQKAILCCLYRKRTQGSLTVAQVWILRMLTQRLCM